MSRLPDWISDSIDNIDASIFTGDTFQDDQCRKEMQEYLNRWQLAISEIETQKMLNKLTGDDNE